LLASSLFKDRKESYPMSVCVPFKTDRLEDNQFYKNLPKQKKDIYASKKFLKDSTEKIIVLKNFSFFLFLFQ
jgi:hypothetical protein